MRVGTKSSVFIAALLVQVAPLLAAARSENNAKNDKHNSDDDRVGGFGHGVGQIDVSLGAHPSLLEGLPPRQQDEIPPLRPINDPPPEFSTLQPLDEHHRPNPGSERMRKSQANTQSQDEKGYDCTAILLERLSKRCCRLPVLVPLNMIDNCTIRDDVSPEYRKRFKVKRGPRCLYDCAFRELNLLSDDGLALDVLQITVRMLEAANNTSWNPSMLRDTIITCNTLIEENVSTKIMYALSGENCSVLPWVMLKCLKKKFVLECPDVEVINKDEDCIRDKARLQGCNPLTLTNTSQVKPASRPETPANDAFEQLKPQTATPNSTPWIGKLPDRRYDVRKTTTAMPTSQVERKRNQNNSEPEQDRESADTPDYRSENIRSNGKSPSQDIKGGKNKKKGRENGRMVNDIDQEHPVEDFEGGELRDREELIFVPSTTVAHEMIAKKEKPKKFHKN
ncbi:uncharacterized protein LOC135940572 [Cloeon dipterum]|uniref:uncharacterized protein LOC135940572 n=1 Tax=Cloeon dipterum TaxID=197152 RepID=UPI00321F6434